MAVRLAKYHGHCSVCGVWSLFVDMAASIRETYQCEKCRASLRERVTADAIVSVYGKAQASSIRELAEGVDSFSNLDIFEPGISGAYRKYLSPLKNYKNSFFWDELSPGETKDGIEKQDLMNLTFYDGSFDLVISSDIFEHIRHPWKAFREVRRVLRPGGFHIFSVPSLIPMEPACSYRVDTTTAQDVHLMKPVYHGDGKGGRSLVYTDFGSDLFDELKDIGLHTISNQADHVDPERKRVNAFISFAV